MKEAEDRGRLGLQLQQISGGSVKLDWHFRNISNSDQGAGLRATAWTRVCMKVALGEGVLILGEAPSFSWRPFFNMDSALSHQQGTPCSWENEACRFLDHIGSLNFIFLPIQGQIQAQFPYSLLS